MRIMGLGINYSDGMPLYKSIQEQAFGQVLARPAPDQVQELRRLTRATASGGTFREAKRRVIDLGDPRSAGWTFLVSSRDPRKDKYIKALKPLAEQRGMKNPDAPLCYNGEPLEQWNDWQLDNFSALETDKPHYVLIVGDPAQVPFRFQSMLATSAAVGRVAFDTVDDLEAYVEKLIRLENAPDPIANREALFFATDGGPSDPTYYSCHYLAEPLADAVESNFGADDEPKFAVKRVMGNNATKRGLVQALTDAKPVVVYTASHGSAAPGTGLETQKRVNGAICCLKLGSEKKQEDWLFSADDIPGDRSFLEGAAVFQFACFGYGTPASSDFAHWDKDGELGLDKVNAPADFIAALPQKLIAHPRGPIIYIGHVDVALLHGFDDPANPDPDLSKRWNPRVEPFVTTIRKLLQVQPGGYAMGDMSSRYNSMNAQLTSTLDLIQKGMTVSADLQSRIANLFLMRSDAQNYMIFGDPAAHIRIPD